LIFGAKQPGGEKMKKRENPIPSLFILAAVLAACSPSTAGNPTAGQELPAQTRIEFTRETGPSEQGLPSAALTRTRTAPPAVNPSSTLPPTPASTADPGCNRAQFVADVSIPDSWETIPGALFTKTWRLKNIGTCTWNSDYALVFDHGERMHAPATQPLTNGTVAPQGIFDVAVDLAAPADPGTYQAFFMLRAPDGSTFGIGADADTAFWAKIIVRPGKGLVVHVVSSTITVAPNATELAFAVCPDGSAVTGGGFSASGLIIVYGQSKVSTQWNVWALNGSSDEGALTAYAICLEYPGADTDQVQTIGTGLESIASHAVATCPAGSILTGGGFYSESDGSVWLLSNSPSGNSWMGKAQQGTVGHPLLTVYAVCLDGISVSNTVVSQNVRIAAGAKAYVEVACPDGTALTGGGWYADHMLRVTTAAPLGGKWRVEASNIGTQSLTLQAQGVCLAIS
jgi:hypothetical protein